MIPITSVSTVQCCLLSWASGNLKTHSTGNTTWTPRAPIIVGTINYKKIRLIFEYFGKLDNFVPGHSSLQDWVWLPSSELQATPLLAGVFAVLVLVLSWLPDPSFAAQESMQVDHEVHVSHWQSTEKNHFSHVVRIFQSIKNITRTFFTARLSSSTISCIAINSIIDWCI